MDNNAIKAPTKIKRISTGIALPIIPKIVIPIVVEIVDRMFKLAKARPNISFFTFSCIKTVFDVLNRGSDIPEHNIKIIY